MKHNTLLKIAKDFGSPVYVYDSEIITSQYKQLTIDFIEDDLGISMTIRWDSTMVRVLLN